MKIHLREASRPRRVGLSQRRSPARLARLPEIPGSAPLTTKPGLPSRTCSRSRATDAAAEVYRSAGHPRSARRPPLPAIVAAHALGKLGRPVDDIQSPLGQIPRSVRHSLRVLRYGRRQSIPSTMLEIGDIVHTGS